MSSKLTENKELFYISNINYAFQREKKFYFLVTYTSMSAW